MIAQGTIEALYAQFKDIQAVASIMTQCALEATSTSFEDFRDVPPSNFIYQYPYGVAVQYAYGHPTRIFTSCGSWRVAAIEGGYIGRAFLEHPSIKLEILKPAVTLGGWTEGPTYYVKKLYGEEMPQPFKRERLWSPQQCKAMWQVLMGKYASEALRGKTPFNAQIKSNPENRDIRKFADQYVSVSGIDQQGMATCVTPRYETIDVYVTDLVLFSSGLIK